MSNSLRPHESQHAKPPCPSPTPGVYPNSCPLNQWCHPTISYCRPLLPLPSVFPSIRVFSNESALRIRWPKYWSFSFNISPSNEHPGLIAFRMDWLDLLAVQGTLKSLLQQHSSKASILWHSALFIVQLLNPCMTTGKTIALTRQTFVGKVMSLLFNMLSRLVIWKDPDAGEDWEQEEKGTTGWDGWMASLTQWTWIWVNSGSWWYTGRPGVLWFMGSQRVGLMEWLNWTELGWS